MARYKGILTNNAGVEFEANLQLVRVKEPEPPVDPEPPIDPPVDPEPPTIDPPPEGEFKYHNRGFTMTGLKKKKK